MEKQSPLCAKGREDGGGKEKEEKRGEGKSYWRGSKTSFLLRMPILKKLKGKTPKIK